jgi:hypothetical protein
MKKILLGVSLLVLSLCAKSQTYFTFDSANFGGRPAIVKMPTGAGPFPVMFEWSTTAENSDASSCGMCNLFNSGTPKIVKAGTNPYLLKGNFDSLKYIIVKIMRGGYSDGVFPDDMAYIMPFAFSYLGSKIDTTKGTDGMYKYVGMSGEERAGELMVNSLVQNTAANNCFYHANPGWHFNHIKKLYISRVSDICQYGSYDPTAAYNHATTKKIWWYRINGGSTFEPDLQTNFATYSPGIVQSMRQVTGVTNTQLSDSMFSIQGQYYFNNIYRDLADDTTTKPPPNFVLPIMDIFPLSIAAQHDPNPPSNFFDGDGVCDPKNGITTDTTSSSNSHHKWDTTGGAPLKPNYNLSGNVYGTIWPGKRNSVAYVLDLYSVPDLSDTTKKKHITDIYLLSGEENGHRTYFYNFDKLYRPTDMADRIKMLARRDSLLTPFATATTNGYTGGWQNIPVDESCRFVLIVLTDSAAHSSQWKEIKFYGNDIGDTTGQAASLTPPTYTGPLPSKKDSSHTFGKLMGTNLFAGVGPISTSHDGDFRLYTYKWYFDIDSTVNHVPSYYHFWESDDVNVAWIRDLKARGKTVHFTNSGSNKFAAGQGTQVDIDSSGLDPEYPWSYLRAGDFAYNWAAKFGKNAISSSLTKWINDAGYPNGLNLFDTYEAGNEVEAHGGSYMQMFMKMSMEYDGHCGLYGVPGRTGIKNADSTMLMSTPGMVDADTSFIKTCHLLTALTRPNKKDPWDIAAFHRYFTNKDTTKGIYYSLEELVGIRGEAPEWFGGSKVGFLKYAERVARNIYKYVPLSKRIDWTEQGYNNTGKAIANTGEAAATYDPYPMLAFGGYTAIESKAVMLARVRFQAMASAWTKYNNYALSNQYGTTDNTIQLIFYTHGETAAQQTSAPFEMTVYYAPWYYQAGFYHQLHDYYLDTVLINGGRTGMWLYKMRNAFKRDSVAFVPYVASYDGSSLSSQSLNFGSLTSQSITKWSPSFTDTTGSNSSLTASGGVLASQSITESPVVYFAQESASNAPPTCSAGNTQIIYLPTSTVTLPGTATDTDGTIASYSWSKTSGPAGTTIVAPTSATTAVTGLRDGAYTFQLTVTDNGGLTATVSVAVYVSLSRTLIIKLK